MKKRLCMIGMICSVLLSSILLPMKSYAQNNVGAIPENISPMIEEYVANHNSNEAAVSVAITNQDTILYHNDFGYINKGKGIPADTDTVYDWGSLTKVLTWISVMQLYEQGKLDFNTDIRTYLPDNYLKKLQYEKAITITDLMNHMGGWQDRITNIYSVHEADVLPIGEKLSLYEPIQVFEPGTYVAYSNYSTALAGYIVECVSGEDYSDYVTNHIFTPLGMNHTSIDPYYNDNAFVQEHMRDIMGYSTDGSEIPGHFYAPDYPAAGACGTVGDIALLMQALLGNEQLPLFEKAETLDTFLQPTHYYPGTDVPELAHGLWFNFYQTPSLGHQGNTPQFSVHMSISPETNVGMIVTTNQMQEMELTMGLGEFVFGQYQAPAVASFEPLQFKDHYTSAQTIENGFCRFYHFFQSYVIKEQGDNTITISSPFMKIPCIRVGENEYVATASFVKGYHFYMDVQDGVVSKISTSTFDLIPLSSGKYIMETITFCILVVAFVIALVSIILYIRRLLLHKMKHQIVPLIMNVLSLMVYVGIFLEMLTLITTGAAVIDVLYIVIYYWIYLVSGLGYTVYLFFAKEKERLRYVTLSITVLIMFFILYWQMIFIV